MNFGKWKHSVDETRGRTEAPVPVLDLSLISRWESLSGCLDLKIPGEPLLLTFVTCLLCISVHSVEVILHPKTVFWVSPPVGLKGGFKVFVFFVIESSSMNVHHHPRAYQIFTAQKTNNKDLCIRFLALKQLIVTTFMSVCYVWTWGSGISLA